MTISRQSLLPIRTLENFSLLRSKPRPIHLAHRQVHGIILPSLGRDTNLVSQRFFDFQILGENGIDK